MPTSTNTNTLTSLLTLLLTLPYHILVTLAHLIRTSARLPSLRQHLATSSKSATATASKMPHSSASSDDAKFYHNDPKWSDVVPLPQNDGALHPLAAIAYTEEYSEAMDYLRAVMAKQEYSERVLELTEHVIGMNPAHYTVW